MPDTFSPVTDPPAKVVQPGSMSLDQALNFVNTPSNQKVPIIPTSNQPTDSNPVIQRTPGDTGSKYDTGYIPSLSLDSYRSENQSGIAQAGLGALRTVGGAILNLGEAASVLASGAGGLAANAVSAINNEFTSDTDKKTGYYGVDDMVNNPLDNFFYGIEDKMKEQFAVYKPSDWNNRSIGSQMSSTAWWADDGASVAAFALSNLIPAGVIADVGLGAKVAGGAARIATGLGEAADLAVTAGEDVGKTASLGKYANQILLGKAGYVNAAGETVAGTSGILNPVGLAKTTDAVAQNAYMTTSEAFFMARDAGKAVETNYLQSKGKSDTNDLNPEEQKELQAAKSTSENYTFWSNMVALTGVSHIEAGFVNKFFGHVSAEEIGHLVDLGKGLSDNATSAATNGVEKFLNTTWQGSLVKNVPKYVFTEGALKANIQNAIQATTSQFGFLGKGDYLSQVAKTALSQLTSADAWKGMMANVVVGGIMGVTGGLKEVSEQNKAVSSAISSINSAKENFVNLQNVMYQRDDAGNIKTDPTTNKPIYNVPAIQDYVANQMQATDLTQIHDVLKNSGNDQAARIVKNEAFTKYALAHLEAGLGDEFIAKVKALNSYKDEDLANMGFDPIDIGKDGNKISISQKTQDLLQKATQIKNDYDQVSRTVGYQDYFKTGNKTADAIQNNNLKNSRTNEAVKLLSRSRTLDDVIKDSNQQLLTSQANSIESGANPLVESINNQARTLQAKLEAADTGDQNGNIKQGSRQDKQITSEIQDLKNNILQQKEVARPELEKLGYEVTPDTKEITDGTPDTPDITSTKEHLQNIEDSKVAKLGLQDRYNDITDYNNGAENFVKSIQNKTNNDIQDQNDTEEANKNEEQYQDGDIIAHGEKSRSQVYVNTQGRLSVNSQPLAQFLKNNPDSRELSDTDIESEKQTNIKNFNINILKHKISTIQSRLKVITSDDDNIKSKILSSISQIENIITNEATGRIRVSPDKLHNELDRLDKALESISDEHKQIIQAQDQLYSSLKLNSIDNNDTINKEIDSLESNRTNLVAESRTIQVIETQVTDLLDKLFSERSLSTHLRESFIPKASKEFVLTKDEIEQLKQINSNLLQLKNDFQSRVDDLNSQSNDLQLELNKLLKTQNDKPDDTGGGDNPTTINSSPIPAIEKGGLFKTAGANSKDGVLNSKEFQKVWGDFANKFDPKNPEGKYLRTVTLDDPEYGLNGSKQDLYKEEDKQYQHKDNIKVLIVNKDGTPVYHQGQLVYTSLPEITAAKTEPEHFANFRYTNKEEAKQSIEDYRNFANQIKNSKEPLKLQITGKSNGRIVIGEPIAAKEAFGKELPLTISLADEKNPYTTIGAGDYPIPAGLVYVNYNGRPVGAETRTLTPKESQAVLDKLKAYAKLRGDSTAVNNKEIINQLKGILLLNQRNANPQFDIYFVKGKNEFIFGDKAISTKDLIEGTYDAQLREFLDTQNHQVDRGLIAANKAYKDVFDKQWPSYSSYLLDGRDEVSETPLTFKIAPLSDDINKPQFLNTYLTYSKPKNEVEPPKKQTVATKTDAAVFDFGNNLSVVSLSDMQKVVPIKEQLQPTEAVSQLIEENEGNAINPTTTTNDVKGTVSGITENGAGDGRPGEEENPTKVQDNIFDEWNLDSNRVKDYSPIDFEKEQNWFRDNISSSIPFDKVKGLVDKQAYGKFSKAGRVLISDLATAGTGYHEAFHVVSQLYLTDKERSELYSKYKKDTNNPQATDRLAEEGLAEEFREFMLTKQSPYKRFFDKILNFIKGILGIGNEDKQLLFNRISNGYFLDNNLKTSSDLDLYKMSNHFDASTTKDLMDSMTVGLVRGLFKTGFTVNDINKFNEGSLATEDANNFKNLYSSVLASVNKQMLKAADNQSNGEHIKNVVKYVNENKAQVQLDHLVYLKKFGINLEVEPDVDLPQDYQRTKDTLGIISSVEFSAKSGMPNVIKLMIGSLPEMINNPDGSRSPVLNNLGLPKISNYRRNVAILTNELSNISSFKEQIAKVKMLSTRIPELSLLFDQLGVSDGQVMTTNLSFDYANLQKQFRQQFDKAYFNYFTQIYGSETDEAGEKTGVSRNYLLDSNTDKLKGTIQARWFGQAFANKGAFKDVSGNKVLDAEYFNKNYSKSLKGQELIDNTLSFYKDLGITFTHPETVDIEGLRSFQKYIIKQINDRDISNVFDKNAQLSKAVNFALTQEASSSLDDMDNQHINPEGKTVYNVSLHDYTTNLAAKINNLTYDKENKTKTFPKELTWDEETQIGNPLMRHSSWKDKYNQGKQIRNIILEGARVDQPGETGTSTSDLSTPDAASLQFTSVLNGKIPLMRAGDKTLEKGFTFDDEPEFASLGDITKYFQGHLIDELTSSYMLNIEGVGEQYPVYAESAKDLRVFKGIFNKSDEQDYKNIITNDKIDRTEAIKQIQAFADRDSVQKAIQDWHGKFVNENLDLLQEMNLVRKSGDVYSLLGNFNNLADKFVGKSDALSEAQMKSLVEQFTFRQLEGNIEQTKLFLGDLAFYNALFKRISGATGTGKTMWVGQDYNQWADENQPREYQSYDGSIKTDKKSEDKIQTLMFNDIKAVSSNFNDYVKTLVDAGLNNEYATKLLDKYNQPYDEADAQGYITLPELRQSLDRAGVWTASQEALYPKLIRGEEISSKDLANFLNSVGVQKFQYFGGQTNGELFVPTFYKFSVMPLIPSVIKGRELEELMHTMLETGHGISLFKTGSKVANKIGNNLYDENGKINLDQNNLTTQEIDYNNLKIQLDTSPQLKNKVIFGTQFRKLVLANLAGKTLTINGKTISGDKMIKSYSDLIDKTVELETKSLIDKLGVKDAGNGNYVLQNPQYLRDLLSDEGLRRQAPDNLLEGIRQVLPEEGEHKQFDVLVSRNKIENILISLVNNNIVKQKTFGDLRVQGASTGFEAKSGLKGRGIADAEKATWWSKVEHVDSEDRSLNFYKADPSGTQPMEVYLPHYFKELIGKDVDISRIDERLLKVLGYRTPTQGLNSMELMKIKGFLPQEAGNLIVVPSEIVVKAGSDFDIDKLSLHFPNYEMVNGEPKYLQYDKETTANSLPHIYNRINDLAWKTIAAPENFQQLITPNSNGQVEEIAKEVSAMRPEAASPLDNGKGYNIAWKKNLDIRQAYLSGKEGIGIAAIHNTNHVLNQITKLLAKPEVKIYLDHNSVGEDTNNYSPSNTIFEEEQSSGYRERTIKNASADATIAIASDFGSAGEKLTKSSVLNQGKKYIPINFDGKVKQEDIDNVVKELNSLNKPDLFSQNNGISLNIAGNGIYTLRGKYTQDEVDKYTHELIQKVISSPNLQVKVRSIRSGGQTGFDEAGIKAGQKLGLPTKVLAPRGYTFRNLQGQDISNENLFKNRFGNTPVNNTSSQVDFSKEREVGADPVNSPTILDNLGAFLNGLVDMANNPFLSTINTTMDTLPVYMYLIKAGVPLRQAIMFMNQPIISEYLKQSAANDSLGLKASGTKLSDDKVIGNVFDRFPTTYKKLLDLSNEQHTKIYKDNITSAKLEGNIKNFKEGKFTYKDDNNTNSIQRNILVDYLNYKDGADGLSDLIQATNADTSGNSTMNAAQDAIDRFNNLKENSIFENVDKYMDDTFIGSFMKAVKTSVQVYKPLFYTERNEVKEVLQQVKNQIGLSKFADSEKAMNLAKNDLINYVLQSSPINNQTIKAYGKALVSGENSIAKALAKAKDHSLLKDNPIIKELFPILSSTLSNEIATPKDLDNIKMFSKKLEAVDQNVLTEGWKDLFNIHPDFAQGLMQYTILQSGLNNSPVNFSQYVPNEYYVPLASQLLTKDADLNGFYDKFIRNNYQNNDLVPKTVKYIDTPNRSITIADGKNAFIRPQQRSKITGRLQGMDLTKYDYIKAWNFRDKAYELYRNTNQIDQYGKTVFNRVSRLGDGYNLKEWTDESMILSNRINNQTVPDKTLASTNELNNLKENFKDANNKPMC